MTTVVDIMRKLAAFADVGDHRHANSDEETIADWQSLRGTNVLKASITLKEARAAREFLRKMDASSTKNKVAIRKATFGDI